MVKSFRKVLLLKYFERKKKMTAETLKPFILPTSNSFNIQKHNPNSKNSGRHLWILIGLSVALLALSAAAVYITVRRFFFVNFIL